MKAFLRRFFRLPQPTVCPARNRVDAAEIRLTPNAYERLCDELGVKQTSQVCGLPIRLIKGSSS